MKWFGCAVTVAAAGPQLLIPTVCPRYFSRRPLGRWLPSRYATGVLKASPPPPPPPRPLPDDFIVWKLVASEGSASEARAGWTSSGVQDYSPLRSSERVVVSFLLNFLKTGVTVQFWVVSVLPQRCACISTHLSGRRTSDKITLGVRTAGALIVFQRATCLNARVQSTPPCSRCGSATDAAVRLQRAQNYKETTSHQYHTKKGSSNLSVRLL